MKKMSKICSHVKYDVYGGISGTLIDALPNTPFHGEETVRLVSYSDVQAIEEVRPGYSRMATKYLEDGHVGICILCEGRLASLGWHYTNYSSKTRRASYFPLQSGFTWIHAHWVASQYRGRGYQKILFISQVKLVAESLGSQARIIMNVLASNTPSVANIKKCGFKMIGEFHILKIVGRLLASWPKRWDL